MIIQGIGVWLPTKKRLNSDWPKSFGKAADATVQGGGGSGDDGGNKNNDKDTTLLSGDRTFNDIDAPLEHNISVAVKPYLERESHDPFLGVRERRVAEPEETVARSSGIAALRALEDARLSPSDVDVVLGNAFPPDFIPSNVASSVAHEIKCRDGVLAFDIEAGCASGIVGLELAQRMLAEEGDSDDDKLETKTKVQVILIVISNLLTKVQPMMHPSCPGIGDAAAAFVLTNRPHGLMIRSIVAHTHPEYSNTIHLVRSKDKSEPKWFEPSERPLHLGSYDRARVKALMQNTISYAVKTIEEATEKAGISTTAELDWLASTQPRGFIPKVVAQILGMPRGQDSAISTYETLAHLNGISFMMNLYEAKRRGLLDHENKAGTKIVCYSQGAGFVRAAAILEVVPPPKLRSSL